MILKFRKISPEYEGLIFDGNNIEEIKEFVRDEIKAQDWAKNYPNEEYPHIIQKNGDTYLFNLDSGEDIPIELGDMILRKYSETHPSFHGVWICKANEFKDCWTQKRFFEKYIEIETDEIEKNCDTCYWYEWSNFHDNYRCSNEHCPHCGSNAWVEKCNLWRQKNYG
jgi:hypothetical protein